MSTCLEYVTEPLVYVQAQAEERFDKEKLKPTDGDATLDGTDLVVLGHDLTYFARLRAIDQSRKVECQNLLWDGHDLFHGPAVSTSNCFTMYHIRPKLTVNRPIESLEQNMETQEMFERLLRQVS